jgi:hypothetical protein
MMVTLLDTDRPSTSTQLSVNTNDKPSWICTAADGRMKLIVCGDCDDKDADTLTELGDCDEDREIKGLSTDHVAWPLDLVCTVPTAFSFEEGLILITDPDDELDDDDSPPTTLTITTGERSSTIVTSKVLSHARSSPADTDRPLSDTLNTSPREMEPRTNEEEFTLIDKREGEGSENTSSPSQLLA